MAVLTWDQMGQRLYETGTKKGVLYPYNGAADASNGEHPYSPGVAWNGLTSVSESPDGGDANDIYADDIKYLSLRGVENFGGTIEAYTYPDAWTDIDGSTAVISGMVIGQQPRKTFGLSYVTTVGNDTELDGHGYKIHLVYGASASPSEKSYETINDSPEPVQFSWEFTTVPVDVKITGRSDKPTALITIDSTKFPKTQSGEKNAKLQALEDALYGTANADPYLPLPNEVYTLLTT